MLSAQDASNSIRSQPPTTTARSTMAPQADVVERHLAEHLPESEPVEPEDVNSRTLSFDTSGSRLLQNASQTTLPFSDSGGSSHHDEPPHRSIFKRPSDESIRSNFSTTSSVFSTASKISRLPHAVKNSFVSVKDFMKSNRSRAKRLTLSHADQQQQQQHAHFAAQTIHYTTPGTSPFSDRESLASRFRRRTPSTMGLAQMFSNSSNSSREGYGVSPSASTSYSVLEVKDPHHQKNGKPKQRSIPSGPAKNGRRNSVVGAATRFLRRGDDSSGTKASSPHTIHEESSTRAEFGFSNEFEEAIKEEASSDQKAVGKLLFGVDIGHMEFFDQEFTKSATSSTISAVDGYDMEPTPSSDAKSDHVTSKSSAHEVVWSRQRAKSCQETKVPSLRQLAKGQYASTAALASHIPSPPPPLPSASIRADDYAFEASVLPVATSDNQRKLTEPKISLSYNTVLVTATLTTLHSKLISDCDQLLASTIIPPSKTATVQKFPEEQLRSIANDLRKMSDMVEWEEGEGPVSKASITAFFRSLDQQISQGQALVDAAAQQKAKDKKQPPYADSNQALATAVKDIVSGLKQMTNQCVCQYHKVFEKSMIIPCKGYKVEGKNRFGTQAQDYPDPAAEAHDYSSSIVEHMDQEAYWYRTYFMGREYTTFVGYVDDDEPLLLSAICEATDDGQKQYRLVIRTKQGPDIRKIIPDSFLLSAPSSANGLQKETVPDTTWKAVVEMSLDMPFDRMKKIDHETMVSSGLESEILRLDEQAVHNRYKFGVVYVKEGQTREEEWLSNAHDSEKFDRFLRIIGRRVELQGYSGWAAGLDTRSGDSGEHTIVDEWNEHSIAYHVSTLIPSRQGDKQQVQKKRHIGNDIVCVVFAEGKQPFNPAAIKSQFLHVFIVVHEEEWEGRTGWRVEVAMAEPVPIFSPPLPEKAIFFHESELRSFILAKLINAEYAAYKSPKFTQPMARAREGILANITERGYKLAKDPEISFFSRHSKSPSTSSDRSSRSTRSGASDHITPTPSRSSMIRELSEGIAGLGRRRSAQQESPDARPKPTRSSKPRKGKANKHAEAIPQQRSRSELDLMQPSTSTTTDRRDGIRHRAQNIFSFGASARRNPPAQPRS